MSVEAWEEHNRSFRYDPPEEDPELWSGDEYTRLYDRAIGKTAGQWTCERCTKPFRNLRSARRHVEQHHAEQLIEQAERRQERDSDE